MDHELGCTSLPFRGSLDDCFALECEKMEARCAVATRYFSGPRCFQEVSAARIAQCGDCEIACSLVRSPVRCCSSAVREFDFPRMPSPQSDCVFRVSGSPDGNAENAGQGICHPLSARPEGCVPGPASPPPRRCSMLCLGCSREHFAKGVVRNAIDRFRLVGENSVRWSC